MLRLGGVVPSFALKLEGNTLVVLRSRALEGQRNEQNLAVVPLGRQNVRTCADLLVPEEVIVLRVPPKHNNFHRVEANGGAEQHDRAVCMHAILLVHVRIVTLRAEKTTPHLR